MAHRELSPDDERMAAILTRHAVRDAATKSRDYLWANRGGLQNLTPSEAQHFAAAMASLDALVVSLTVPRKIVPAPSSPYAR